MDTYVLTLSCADRTGIVAAVAGELAAAGGNILDSQQYGDPSTDRFFMRVAFSAPEPPDISPVAARFAMAWQLHRSGERSRVLVLVSRHGHCLNDLLYRWRSGLLSCDLVGVVSNHPDFAALTQTYGLPFHHLPVTPGTRPARERALLDLLAAQHVDLVVLARYMQVLSPAVCERYAGRIINIHHSFLPSFKGAAPYAQAHARGVKLIGATAHYVTADLDEGPIIEQEVARVDHSHSTEQLAAVGRDVESLALARAVRWHVEHRVLLDGDKTVVFR